MRFAAGFVAGLLAASAPADLRAQDIGKPPAPAPPDPSEDAPSEDSPSETTITGPDGKPLPPEIERQVREHLKKNPLPPAPKGSPGAGDKEIVVTGQRPRGSVIGDIPPVRTFNPLDIKAFGANDIGELLQTLGPQVSSGQGRDDNGPVVLLNGKRVSSFAEIARIPTEAIQRMEVFPEELALKYGYRPDQKVVNIVTFERFSSRSALVSFALPTEGGRDTTAFYANFLNITRQTRINANADYNRSGSLLESERNIVPAAGTSGFGRLRSLLPETERLTLNGAVSGEWLSGVSSTLNGRFEAVETKSLLGPGPDGPLERDIDSRAAHLGTELGGRIGEWGWSFTGNYDRSSIATSTDTGGAPGPRDEARSVNSVARAELVLNGSVLELPSGPLTASLRAGGEMRDFTSRSLRGGLEAGAELSRDSMGIQANVDLPIARRSGKTPAWLGDLSANLNVAFDELSDFGTLRTFGYGLYWSPVPAINLIASATNEEGAPTMEQLGAPLVVTPNVRTFDFSRREAVDITRTFGGNPGLRSDDREVLKLGINAKPLSKTDLTLSIDYIKTRIDDPIASFPVAAPEIEAAFPQRFERDSEGRLQRIDSRPLNFRRSDQEQLRFGINFSRPLGPVPAYMRNAKMRFVGSEADLKRSLPPGAFIIKSEPGSAAARQFENASSRLTLSVHYTLHLVDEILVREGGPVLDLLNGSATDSRGGRPRHGVELEAGIFERGLGARLKVDWQSGTRLRGLPAGPLDDAGDLAFSSRAIVNLNLFANLAERFGGAKAPEWLKGTRASIGINNLLGTRPRVRDGSGSTPLSYQPAYLDPLGRSLSFTLRKVF
jgi:hypothetical protein